MTPSTEPLTSLKTESQKTVPLSPIVGEESSSDLIQPSPSIQEKEDSVLSEKELTHPDSHSHPSPTLSVKELEPLVQSQVEKLFSQSVKDILEKRGIKIIKKISEDIAWKIIPEISKQMIQTEINKIKKESSS